MPDHIVVLTGAGISAESGLSTFRDSGGLWEGYDINDVATIEGWKADPKKVLNFYNLRRKQAAQAKPNKAHSFIAELQDYYNVTVITQNVDDLHERAGSDHVLHLHGKLNEAKSEIDDSYVINIGANPIKLGQAAPDGSQLRPNVVWFGEPVPMIEKAAIKVSEADVLVVIGTSLVVYPAAGLVDYARVGIKKFIIDPSTPELFSFDDWQHIKEKATTGVDKLKKILL